jgi:acetylglutamate kinase
MAFRLLSALQEIVGPSFLASRQQTPDGAISDLNDRFREHGVGYQFEGGEIVRVDSQYVHAEAVKPAISLLNTAGFEGASEEFFNAHEHYRKHQYADAIADALKAFESTMKAICDENGWVYNKGKDTAKDLIKVMLDNELVPRYMENHLAGLRNTLGAGLPTVRNKLGGHGQGKEPRKVPDYFAGYALHLAATNIVFLVEAHQALDPK